MRLLKVGELFRVFEVNYNGVKHEVFTSIDGGIGLHYDNRDGNEQFVFYTGDKKDQFFDKYPKVSNNYTVLIQDISTIDETSVYIDAKLKKAIDQDQIFYIEKRDKTGITRITDQDFLKCAQEEYSKLSSNIGINGAVPKRLLKYGEVLTDKKYFSDPAIARDEEIELVELGLLTPKKSPLLLGLPGIGKTAIVEGLAYRIQTGNVPLAIQNKTIFNVDPASLISGCENVGMVEENVLELINGIKGKENIILFIDEFHTLIGLGMGSKSNIDVANMLKPHLANGKITIIGSTTLEEYEKIVLKDKAFARRFKKIDVYEPKLEDVVRILFGSLPYYEQVTGVNFSFSDEDKQTIFECISGLTESTNRIQDKHYPDITLEILADSFGFARLNSRDVVEITDILKAIHTNNAVNKEAKDEYIERLNNLSSQMQLKLTKN